MTEKKKFTKEQHRAASQQNPKNKENATKNKKKRWKKYNKKHKKNLNASLQQLEAYINGKYHTH